MIATVNDLNMLELSADELDMVDGGGIWKAVAEFCYGVVEGWSIAHGAS